MNYQVSEAGGESVRVGLRELGEGIFEVSIGGESVRIDAISGSGTIYSLIEDGEHFEAMVDERGAHGFDVHLAGRVFHLEVVDERIRLLAGAASPTADGPQTVSAEMPGKVVTVSARVGETVDSGQGLVVIEAMKMENEITSPIDGVVQEISVAEGDTVEAGSPLFTVVPVEEEGD